jgi:hypothetical protein
MSRQRVGGLGSTSMAAVLGVSPWAGPWDLWSRVHGADAPAPDSDWRALAIESESRRTEDQERGTWWESHLLEWYAERAGFQTWSPICTVQHPTFQPFHDSPDGFAWDPKHGPGLVEVKTARYSAGWGTDGEEIREGPSRQNVDPLRIVPSYNLTQGYAHLEATGLNWLDWVVGCSFNDIRTIRLWADHRYQSWMIRTVKAWHHKHITMGHQPDPDASKPCRSYLATLPVSGIVEADEDVQTVLAEYAQIKAAEDAEKERREALRARVHAAMAATGTTKILNRNGPTASISKTGSLTIRT